MTAIAITDSEWGIAKGGRQVLHIPEDVAFFRGQTTGGTVVMGRKTCQALPGGKPLPNRRNLVLTRKPGLPLPAGFAAISLAELPALLAGAPQGSVYCIGGGEIYTLLLPYCKTALVTRVYTDTGADVFFPNLDEKNSWKIQENSEIKSHENIAYQFIRYSNSDAIALA